MQKELTPQDFALLSKSSLAQGYLFNLAQSLYPNHAARELITALTKNKNLAPTLWSTLFQSKGPSKDIAQLLHSATTRQQALLVHSAGFPLVSIEAIKLGLPHLTDQDILDVINAPFFDSFHAASLLQSGQAPEALVTELWQQVLTIDRSEPLQHGRSTMSTELHATVLEAVAGKYKAMDDATLLHNIIAEALPYKNIARLIDLRPTIAPLLLSLLQNSPAGRADTDILLAIAISQHLTPTYATSLHQILQSVKAPGHRHHQVARALAENPANSPELRYESLNWLASVLDEGSTIRKEIYDTQLGLLEQQVQNQLQPLPAPWSQTPAERITPVMDFMRLQGFICYPTLTLDNLWPALGTTLFEEAAVDASAVIESISPKLDAAGLPAWDTFLSMLPSWRADLDELLETALSTSKA